MKINHVTLLVKNRDESEKFYTEILGLDKKEVGNSLWIKIGDQYIHLAENSGEPVPNTFYHFGIEIDNLSDYLKKLKEKGVEFFYFSENKLANFIRDPDGNLIEFIDTNDIYFK
jgi:catechol 2,3-dioxygenase-like lactoylglutathione lyase family enzyme